jgi:hypothetical protein
MKMDFQKNRLWGLLPHAPGRDSCRRPEGRLCGGLNFCFFTKTDMMPKGNKHTGGKFSRRFSY